MYRVEKLPASFKRFARIGGVLHFAVFEDTDGSEDEIVVAIRMILPDMDDAATARLRALGGRRTREKRFFGDWYDPDSGALLRVGDWKTQTGEQLHNPRLKSLDRVRIVNGAAPLPDPGLGGQFAYAFSSPPYPLRARSSEIQSLFDDVRAFLFPSGLDSDVLDWSSPDLPDVSPYFAIGMEWWGVFLFSIHTPALRRLTIAMASMSD